MIPAQNIVAWGNVVPWADQRQVEQDLIISRALIEIFSDAMLRDALRFRGGTALNKLHFPAPLRYSEDIDLVRTSAGPIGPLLDQLRVVLEPRAQAQERMFAKLANPRFLLDMRPLLPAVHSGRSADRGSHGQLVSPGVHHLRRPATGPALGKDAGHKSEIRHFMVSQQRPASFANQANLHPQAK